MFTNTRSWKNYWTTSIRVTLKKGENTVLLGNANGYAPNFDSMAVARTAVQTSPEPLPEPSVDKSAMQTLISKAKGVAEKDCTKESYAVLSAKAMLVVLITVPTVPVRMPSATPVPRLG